MSPTKEKKLRVYEIAKDLKMSSDAVVEMIRALDVEVRSHMSTVDPGVVDLLRQKMEREKRVVKEELIRRQTNAKPSVEPTRPRAVPPVAKAVPRAVPKPVAVPKAVPPEPKAVPPVTKPVEEVKPAASAAPSSAPPKAAPTTPPAAKRAPEKPRPAAPRTGPKQARSGSGPRTSAAPRSPSAPVRREMAPGFKPPLPSTGGPPGGGRPRTGPGRRRDKKRKRTVDEKQVKASVRQTLASMEAGHGTKRRRRDRDANGNESMVEADKNLIRVAEFITVGELALQMDVKPPELLAASMKLGMMVNINRRLDKDSISLLAQTFEYDVDFISEYGQDRFEEEEENVTEENLTDRPPVITIMGHVDHGKTSLLDYIRKTNVIAGEAGGITQHIGAYQVVLEGRRLTFLDTPGHEAFTAMRARGAQVTDIVVIVIAADDRVMPQTIEAIDHARAANVPIVIAINKIDLPGADPEMVKQDLTRHNVIVEEFGGDVPAVPISAKMGTHIDKLLEILILQSDLLELKADPKRRAKGVVLEAKMERGRGIIPTVLIQSGTLKVGHPFVAGQAYGKVRAMQNERGQVVIDAGPSTPVEVLGWDSIPQAGDTLNVLEDEREAREIANKRKQLVREHESRPTKHVSLTDLHAHIQEGMITNLKLIIKGDVDGSVEALAGSLGELSSDEVRLKVIHQGVGTINENDVQLAVASDAVIIGFHVRPDPRARELANRESIDIHLYQVIYEAVDEVKKAMAGLLKPEIREIVSGSAEVRKVFQITKSGAVAGCMVLAGKIMRNGKARLIRNQDVIWEGDLDSLKRFKEDVKDVQSGFECGIKLAGYDELKEGDIIEGFQLEEVARTL